MVIFLCLLSVCLRNDIWIALFTLSHKTYIFLLMCCQLQEQSVWEGMEGGKQEGELLLWGHSRGKVPCNTAGPKAEWPVFTELSPAPRKQTSSSLCPDFTRTGRLPALALHRGVVVQNEVPRINAPTRNQIVSRSDFLCFCSVLPIPKFSPSSKPEAQLFQPCCSPAGRGCHWPWAAGSRGKDWTYLPGTDTSGASPCTHPNFHEEM